MKKALIGYTGFVGGNLLRQGQYDDLYNSKNIEEIKGKSYDLIICAGVPAVKWKANQNPDEDLRTLERLMDNLRNVETKKIVLISTVDVYDPPVNVYEDTVINPEVVGPYGEHRYLLEQFVREYFSESIVVRLPGLFGKGLKKNFIYDLINDNCLDLTHYKSVFQFYNLEHITKDIEKVIENSIDIINLATEPVSVIEVAKICLGMEFTNVTERPSVNYDMRSKHSHIFNGRNGYLYNKAQVLSEISQFVKKEKGINA
jgi:nucleoside-diphosphate-sugar epimerase